MDVENLQVKTEETSKTVQLVVFTVGSENYAVEIEEVQEVIRMSSIKNLPRSPSFILGVMNLRGNIIPIVGLREKFSIQSLDFDEFTRIIVVNYKGKLTGMVVDEVSKVVRVPLSSIEANPDMVSDQTRALVRGITKINDEIIFLVKLDFLIYALDEIQYEDA